MNYRLYIVGCLSLLGTSLWAGPQESTQESQKEPETPLMQIFFEERAFEENVGPHVIRFLMGREVSRSGLTKGLILSLALNRLPITSKLAQQHNVTQLGDILDCDAVKEAIRTLVLQHEKIANEEAKLAEERAQAYQQALDAQATEQEIKELLKKFEKKENALTAKRNRATATFLESIYEAITKDKVKKIIGKDEWKKVKCTFKTLIKYYKGEKLTAEDRIYITQLSKLKEILPYVRAEELETVLNGIVKGNTFATADLLALLNIEILLSLYSTSAYTPPADVIRYALLQLFADSEENAQELQNIYMFLASRFNQLRSQYKHSPVRAGTTTEAQLFTQLVHNLLAAGTDQEKQSAALQALSAFFIARSLSYDVQEHPAEPSTSTSATVEVVDDEDDEDDPSTQARYAQLRAPHVRPVEVTIVQPASPSNSGTAPTAQPGAAVRALTRYFGGPLSSTQLALPAPEATQPVQAAPQAEAGQTATSVVIAPTGSPASAQETAPPAATQPVQAEVSSQPSAGSQAESGQTSTSVVSAQTGPSASTQETTSPASEAGQPVHAQAPVAATPLAGAYQSSGSAGITLTSASTSEQGTTSPTPETGQAVQAQAPVDATPATDPQQSSETDSSDYGFMPSGIGSLLKRVWG